MQHGLQALQHVTRVLRNSTDGDAEERRGALLDYSTVADRMASFADDQRSDDWVDFHVSARDVAALCERNAWVGANVHQVDADLVHALDDLAVALTGLVFVDS
jgi:hypothetical protein